MNFQEQIASLLQQTVHEKDEEIKTLKEQNERLREENEKLKQIKSSDSQFTSNRFGEVRNRATELKKVLEEFLEHPNRPIIQRPYISPISIPNSNIDVNKPSTSTNEPPKIRSGPADEPSANVTNHINHINRTNFNSQEDFGVRVYARQDFRPETDTDIVVQATQAEETLRQQQHYNGHNGHVHNGHSHNLPSVLPLNNNGRRFNGHNNGYNNVNGLNNNNNNRTRNNHNNNNNSKYTIFISWPGSATIESLRELFENCNIDVADIRYTAPKQFAHVDLKSEAALSKAMALNGEVKDKNQGALRVEHGKPRSSNNNTTENGQRTQNQNKNNYNRQNNKNVNGYNSNLIPKYNNNKYTTGYNNHHNNPNNHNNGSNQYTTDE
ncbi:hypothetical protein C1645_751003, partial [Glomus cerebriforme]